MTFLWGSNSWQVRHRSGYRSSSRGVAVEARDDAERAGDGRFHATVNLWPAQQVAAVTQQRPQRVRAPYLLA